MSPPNIPIVYRLWHLWLEPVMALNGAKLLWVEPNTYHEFMPKPSKWHPDARIVYNQLAAAYLLFAYNQAVTLRLVHDVRTWKVLMCGMMVCDTGHVYSIWAEMGTQDMLSPGSWRFEDWVTLVTTIGPIFLRLAFVFGVGLDRGGKKRD
ncbi:hypothetical protein OPT61_g2743 [Boeremia exigua]|uniref:Uncharacterized protein n=1 Tax=Boeremia exigua TaxID=749465 RepID=A0ACC2IKF7_9PLEO|nr:hypothetical protein OPT61_g2743 [Boeremia exigua]